MSIAETPLRNYTGYMKDLSFEECRDEFLKYKFKSARKFEEFAHRRIIYLFEGGIMPDGVSGACWRVSVRHNSEFKKQWEEIFNFFSKPSGHLCPNCSKEVLHIGTWAELCDTCSESITVPCHVCGEVFYIPKVCYNKKTSYFCSTKCRLYFLKPY